MTETASKNLITIVIPLYNRAHLIGRTLDSFAAQDMEGAGIIVVDNGSTDGSATRVEEWRRQRQPAFSLRVVTEPRKGAPQARNRGAAEADTPFLMFFDSDDEAMPGLVAQLRTCITRWPDADILGWDTAIELPSGGIRTGKFGTHHPLSAHLAHSCLSTQRYAVRRDFFTAAGGWDERLTGWDDFELGVRLLLRKPRMRKILPDGCHGVRTHFTEESITGRSFSATPAKWEQALDLIAEQLARECPQALDWTDYRRAVLAAEYRREGDRANAARLLAECLHLSRHPRRARLFYLWHRLIGRGTWLLAKKMSGTGF